MSKTEQRNSFLKIRAVATALDALLANNDSSADENINTLSMMLLELCNDYDSKDE